jgi:hypothetical protein
VLVECYCQMARADKPSTIRIIDQIDSCSERTALSCASWTGSVAAVKMSLEHGAHVNAAVGLEASWMHHVKACALTEILKLQDTVSDVVRTNVHGQRVRPWQLPWRHVRYREAGEAGSGKGGTSLFWASATGNGEVARICCF